VHATIDSISLFNIKYGSTSSNIITAAGNNKVGVFTQLPRSRFDINGDLAYRSATLTLSNGQNNNINIETSRYSYYRISGPSAAFSLTGFHVGTDGRVLTVYNTTAQIMTVENQSGFSSATNRIITGTGSNMIVNGGGSVTMQYNGTDSRWIVISSNNTQTAGGGYWSTSGNTGTDTTVNYIGTTDATGLIFKTAGTYRMNILSNGQVSINNMSPVSGDLFSVYSTTSDDAVNIFANGTGRGMYVSVASTNNSGDGMEISKSGGTNSSGGRGLDVYINTTTNGDIGLAVSHNGTGRASNFQQQNASASQPAIFASVSGNGRVIQAQNSVSTTANAVGFFSQAATGTDPITYGTAAAVYGQTSGIRSGTFTASGGSDNTHAVHGEINFASALNFNAIGVFGSATTPNAGYGYGVYGQGNFYGVYANGNMGASGTKSFMIDHPLDPANKFLKHFALESPEVLNMYRGNVLLDANGEAIIQLPSYFNAINIEFSYVLTPVGAPAGVYIKEEITTDGKFSIAGGNAGQKVSWYVYADRNDAYLQQKPQERETEITKPEGYVGKYLMPELYNQPKEKGIFYGGGTLKMQENMPEAEPARQEDEPNNNR
jgi:hypothetical protein